MNLLTRFIFGMIFFAQILNGFDTKTASKIYDKLFYGVFKKNIIYVYTNNQTYKTVILGSQYLKLVDNVDDANIVLFSSGDDLTYKMKNKLIFATDYDSFRDNSNAIGAFYWNKGRPEIVFSGERLENAKLSLSGEFERYLK